MNASGAPMGGGGSLHDIMRHISAEMKETTQVASDIRRELTAATTKLAEDTADMKVMMQAQVREKAALVELLEQLGPALLLRGGQRDQTAPSSLGKRQREAATTTTGGPSIEDAASHGRNDTDLDAYRRERDQLAADLDADAAARTTAATSTSSSTSTNGNSVQQMRDLASVYLFGLERVGALQDLRQAPDAILPGNFVEQPVVAAAASAAAAPTAVATTTNVELATTKSTESATTTTVTTEAKTPVVVAASAKTKIAAVADDPTK
jgi:hypothetical protein